MVSNPRFRIRCLSFGVILVAALVIMRLFMLQIFEGDARRESAQRQYAQMTAATFNRGNIFFTTKDGTRVYAATLKKTYLIAINPGKIADPVLTAQTINESTVLDTANFFKRAAKTNDSYEVVARGLDETTAKAIHARKLPGVMLYEEANRFYPGGKRGAHVLGFIAQSKTSGDAYLGRYGVERSYEEVLARPITEEQVNVFVELFTDVSTHLLGATPREGDVVLSIEPTVQSVLEKELAGIALQWNTAGVGGIILEPTTGRILALAAVPTFDPNEFSKATSTRVFQNTLIENVFEMGSIMKPITIAFALDEKVLTAKTVYRDEGFRVINDKRIENFDGKGRGMVNMQEVLNQSLNTGAVFALEQLGIDRFRKRMVSFGFATTTGVDLPSEAWPLAQNLDSKRLVEHATMSYGQGIASTPLAMVRALSVLANGGYLVEPHVLDRIVPKQGTEKVYQAHDAPRRVLGEDAAREISRMLTVVVDKALVGGTKSLSKYTVAAKTGTALVAKESGGGYYDDRYMHTFFGYLPAASNARFLVFLFADRPVGAKYASQTLTDPWSRIVSFLLHYYDIPPDRDISTTLSATSTTH